MAQLGKFEFTILDDDGNALPNISISIYKQGAFITSTQAGPTYTVNDPGAIVIGDSLNVDTLTSPTRTVTNVTATQVTVGGAGFGSLVNNQRLVDISTGPPDLYADAQGAESKANPLTTDASGKAFCWAIITPYDIRYTGTGYTTRLETDRVPMGQEDVQSNVFTSGTAKAFRLSTLRTLSTAGAKIQTWENPRGTEKASIDKDGDFATSGDMTVAGNLAVTGNETVGGTLGVTGATTVAAITASGLITANAGITSAAPFTYSGAAGSFALTAGSIQTADLETNCVVVTRTADGTADQTITNGAYNTASYVDITGATLTFTPSSTTSEIEVIAYCPSAAAGAGAYQWWAIIKHGTTIVAEGGSSVPGSNPTSGPTLIYRVTGLSGSQTFKVQVQCVTADATVNNSTNAATGRVTRIIAKEFKK